MTPLLFMLLTLSIGLAIALAVVLRRNSAAAVSDGVQPSDAVVDVDPLAFRIESAAVAAPLGLIVLDEAGVEVFANDAVEAFVEPTPGNAVLKVRLRSFLEDAAGSATGLRQDIELLGPTRRIISLRSAPLLSETKRIGTAAFIDDQTAASRIDSMREDFIANASHELKTPLGALSLLAEALGKTEDPEVRQDLAERLQSESARMTRIVQDILNLALVEEELEDVELVELCDVVDAALDQTALLAETSGIDIVKSCSSAVVSGDRRQLVSAAANLMENAVGYSAARGNDNVDPVSVTVRRVEQKAVLVVQDHGIGIPERHQQRIFERFYRVDRGRSRARGGTGLGLSIVRHVVENHHGKVSVESVPGEGSVFRIELPVAET